MQKRVAPGSLRALRAASSTSSTPSDFSAPTGGLVVRALRAVGAVLRAAAGLDAEQRAELHLVGGVMLAVDALRAKEQLRQRQIVNGADFLQRRHAHASSTGMLLMPRMRIVADANIPLRRRTPSARSARSCTMPARGAHPRRVREADLLLYRSTVKVNEALLGGSRVRFVATATIGIDHLDTAWLDGAGSAGRRRRGRTPTRWCSGSPRPMRARAATWRSRQLGIVGVGNVGRRIERLWRALDVTPPLLCDPPRARARRSASASSRSTRSCSRCDLVTLHVPLTQTRRATRRCDLLDARRLRAATPGWSTLAAARCSTRRVGARRRPNSLLLDVFEGEPTPDPRAGRARAAGDAAHRRPLARRQGQRHADDLRRRLRLSRRDADLAHARLAAAAAKPLIVDRADDGGARGARSGRRRLRHRIATTLRCRARRTSRCPTSEPIGAAFRRYRERYPERRELDGRVVRFTRPLVDAIRMLNAYGARGELAGAGALIGVAGEQVAIEHLAQRRLHRRVAVVGAPARGRSPARSAATSTAVDADDARRGAPDRRSRRAAR